MAKTGIEYFSFDVDFFQDEKIQFVSSRFGTIGEIITIKLLCKIYRNGYFVDWNDDSALLFAKSVGDNCQHTLVKDVVYELVKRGFFNKDILDRFGVLTSRGIQKRYFEAVSRRKKVEVISNYLLIETSENCECIHFEQKCTQDVDITANNVDITGKNADIFQQSKVKESKVNQSKGKQSNYPSTPDPTKLPFADNVLLTNEEHDKLIAQYGEEQVSLMIDVLSNYKHSSGKKYKSDYHAILTWVAERVKSKAPVLETKSAAKEDVFYRIQKIAMEVSGK